MIAIYFLFMEAVIKPNNRKKGRKRALDLKPFDACIPVLIGLSMQAESDSKLDGMHVKLQAYDVSGISLSIMTMIQFHTALVFFRLEKVSPSYEINVSTTMFLFSNAQGGNTAADIHRLCVW